MDLELECIFTQTYLTPSHPKRFSLCTGPDYYGDDIFDWSVGAASLPAPPRRTLQRMGVPEQLRQFFLLKVPSGFRVLCCYNDRDDCCCC